MRTLSPVGEIRRRDELRAQRALWSALVLVLTGVIGAGVWSLAGKRVIVNGVASSRAPRLPVYGTVPDFSLIERSGRRVEGSEFRGKIWTVNFIYTSCPDTCALQTAVMARIQADLSVEPDVRLVSITVDPERDTPQVLGRYADRFRADRTRWLFLTGEREAITRFAHEGLHVPVSSPGQEARAPESDGIRSSDLSRSSARFEARSDGMLGPAPAIAGGKAARILHSARLILVDRRSRIRSYYDGTDMGTVQRVFEDVKALRQEE